MVHTLVPIEFTIANIVNMAAIIVGTVLIYSVLRKAMPEDAKKWFQTVILGALLFGIGQEFGEAFYYSRAQPLDVSPAFIVLQWGLGPLVFMIGAYKYYDVMKQTFSGLEEEEGSMNEETGEEASESFEEEGFDEGGDEEW